MTGVALAADQGSSRYLPGLDGVRAIAIIAVLLFHLGIGRATGGFLGVDVFFTLSGFLITGILLNELAATGGVRFGRFYLRRARRLLPALVLMLLGTSLLVLIFARDTAHELGVDTRAAVLYVTNWWYVLDARSYFEMTGRPPLLHHLWSLAIEEQFYLLWPLLAFGAYRWGGRRRLAQVAGAGALASAALMSVLAIVGNVPSAQDSARLYFGTDTHASTLLVGAVLAVVWEPQRLARITTTRGTRAVSAAGTLALIALVACFVWASSASAWLFRGGFLVVGLLSSVVVAAASLRGSGFAAALSVAPLRYLGTRSYGIYLWHWPVFQLTRPDRDLPFAGISAMAVSVGITIGLAELSYRYVEMPIRRGAIGRIAATWPRRTVEGRTRLAALVATAVVLVLGLQASLATAYVPDESDYLGGTTAVGAGRLAPVGKDGAVARSDAAAATVTAIGDSVLLGARDALRRDLDHVVVDAAIARQPAAVFERVEQRRKLGQLGEVVVVAAGANGLVRREAVTSMLQSLRSRDRVVLLTSRAPVAWEADSNDSIRAAAAAFPNARVVDWNRTSRGHRDYFYADGTHLTPKGARAYAAALAEASRLSVPQG